jgi:hypothetical protein
MYQEKIPWRHIYQTGFNRENFLVRLIFIAIAIIPAGFLTFFVGGAIYSAIVLFIKHIGIYDKFGSSSPINISYISFLHNFADAVGILLGYILIYTILRFIVKLKTHYIDMALMLVVLSVLWSPKFDGPEGWLLADLGFSIAIIFLFCAIIFALFAAVTALLDKLTALKDWLKFIIALAVSPPAGMLISWLVWAPIARNYLR